MELFRNEAGFLRPGRKKILPGSAGSLRSQIYISHVSPLQPLTRKGLWLFTFLKTIGLPIRQDRN
jgi:hypothetical protein